MAFRLIGQDVAIRVTLGGSQDGTPNWGSATSIKAYARRISVTEGTEKSDVSALGDTIRVQRVRRGYQTLEIECLVPSTGPLFAGALMQYAKVEIMENALWNVYDVPYYGVVTDRTWEAPDGEQTEKITVEVWADGAA